MKDREEMIDVVEKIEKGEGDCFERIEEEENEDKRAEKAESDQLCEVDGTECLEETVRDYKDNIVALGRRRSAWRRFLRFMRRCPDMLGSMN